MSREDPFLPLYWPWTDTERKLLRPLEFLRSRRFSLFYLGGIISIWLTLGFGHWGSLRCETLGEQLACSSAIWPNKLVDAHEMLHDCHRVCAKHSLHLRFPTQKGRQPR